jgi:methyltransferase (TIGR00027 family)
VKGDIRNVADTALWVASLRARETARGDAVIHDEWAELLGGERGRAIARSMSPAALVAWGVVMRTSAIDRLVQEVLTTGIDVVVNLGAGMDTRPYRLALPASVHWIEIDLPAVVDAKNGLLHDVDPHRRVERIAMDLLDVEARRAVFERQLLPARNVLVIAEGVIPYWSSEAVGLLAADLTSIPAVRHWLLDFENAGRRAAPRRWLRRMQQAPFLFQVDDWFDFFGACGWRAERVITSGEESARTHRPYPGVFPQGWLMHLLPAAVRGKILSASGAALLGRPA